MGLSTQLNHDDRYDVADEYLEVLYKLWEGSWEEGAVLRDKQAGQFADHTKVHPILHEGKYFKVPGIHICEPSPQRTPVLYQTGLHLVDKNLPVKMRNVFYCTTFKNCCKENCSEHSSEIE